MNTQGLWQIDTIASFSARFAEMRNLGMVLNTARSAEHQFIISAETITLSGHVITLIPRMLASVKCAEVRRFISFADCSRIGEKEKEDYIRAVTQS